MTASFDPNQFDQELHQPLPFVRNGFTWLMTGLAFILTAIALMPLFAMVGAIVSRGVSQLSWEVFVSLPAPLGMEGEPSGFANAIVGTLTMVGLGS
ncbi:MAG: hypothetical protein ACO4AJ_15165, partial [Prochlorothrix sp.]